MTLALTAYTASSAVGHGRAALLDALRAGRGGLEPCDFETAQLQTWIGEVPGVDTVKLPLELAAYDCRNNRLALLGLRADGFEQAARAAMARHGAERVALVLGTSTSGILSAELAYRERDASGALPEWFDYGRTHNTGSLVAFVRDLMGLRGPAFAISTACSSSAKAFAAADRLIAAGLADAAIVGGVDSLCLTTLYGFASLELTSSEPCRPGDVARQGVSIGEAAVFALLERSDQSDAAVVLNGWGEASDAHHMSAPHPEGRGSRAAMQGALARAGLAPADIDYINLHGTATPANDVAEGLAVASVFGTSFGSGLPCSSTKGMTGHTLGAAGALEAVVSALALEHGLVPASVGTRVPDPAIPVALALQPSAAKLRHVLSNSFGFGGSNASLVLSRRAA
ncbi:beta-ketoacyl-[acyl-carrier-protein] synthase family protein [Ottowia testudinis]|uniref:Beta-ketoacyl-[acyl-carrier-protein] synthase family protein n=1 Tax=Ottowia testudinis TaxID=2816950 RepID=A0A975H1F4_9BURK|nr:beta-ketoacyl-[acyl-carrier-protein] synthase family protein [Ottowia testudinis]QTD43699.1 beta-ketoacyl-[acyl-carrier-protein] synthase family protein [Ottowia testudinis]